MAEIINPDAVLKGNPDITTVDSWYTHDTCLSCGEADTIVQLMVVVHPARPTSRWVFCTNCQLVFVSPRPTEKWLAAYYKKGYRLDTHGTEDATKVPQSSGAEEVSRGMKILADLERMRGMGTIGSHLDIGSSTGALIAGVMEKFQCTRSVGVEPNDAWREFSENSFSKFQTDPNRQGMLPAGSTFKTHTKIEDVPKSPKYELITISHVLEHTVDPVSMLTRLRKSHLLSKGLMYIEVPYWLGGEVDPLLFPHMIGFTPTTLMEVITRAGLFPLKDTETFYASEPYHKSPGFMGVYCTRIKPIGDKDSALKLYNLNHDHVQRIRDRMRQERQSPVYKMG